MGVVIVEGKGQFGREFGASHYNQWGLCCIVVRERRTLLKLLWGLVLFWHWFMWISSKISAVIFVFCDKGNLYLLMWCNWHCAWQVHYYCTFLLLTNIDIILIIRGDCTAVVRGVGTKFCLVGQQRRSRGKALSGVQAWNPGRGFLLVFCTSRF